MQAVYQAAEYDEVNYKILEEEYSYEKLKAAGMPDFE